VDIKKRWERGGEKKRVSLKKGNDKMTKYEGKKKKKFIGNG